MRCRFRLNRGTPGLAGRRNAGAAAAQRGAELLSHPAGRVRAPQCRCRAEDERAAQALLASNKDHDEHRHVVEAIIEGLAPYCSHIDAQPRPVLHATASMWHLAPASTPP